jgi:hypothetical protein
MPSKLLHEIYGFDTLERSILPMSIRSFLVAMMKFPKFIEDSADHRIDHRY